MEFFAWFSQHNNSKYVTDGELSCYLPIGRMQNINAHPPQLRIMKYCILFIFRTDLVLQCDRMSAVPTICLPTSGQSNKLLKSDTTCQKTPRFYYKNVHLLKKSAILQLILVHSGQNVF
jgi:hypothetical protein